MLRFSIVKARAEGMAQALTAQETAIATAAQRRCVDPIIAIPPREPAYFLEPFVWPQKLFSSRAVRFSEGVAVQPRGLAVAAINVRAGCWLVAYSAFASCAISRSWVGPPCVPERTAKMNMPPPGVVFALVEATSSLAPIAFRHRGANTRSDTQSPNSAADRKRISLPVSRGGRTTFICSRLP